MLGALVGLGLGCAVLRVNPPRRRRRRARARSNPPVAKRSKDFAEFGTYDVVLGDGTTVQISRDGGSGGGGWWYVEWPNLHYSQRLLGFTKAEALAAVEDKVARLRAGN